MSSEPKRRVEAEEFVLRDANGVARAALSMTLDGPGLFLYDQSGIVRLGLLIGNDAPGVALFDSLGRPRVSLGLAIDETATLLLRDVKGTPLAAMIVEETGPRLIISEAIHGARVELTAQSGEASLMFADQNGKPRMVQGTLKGVPGITLMDAGGGPRARLEADKETSTFELYNSDGKASSSHTLGGIAPRLQVADLEAKLTLEVAARKQLEKTLGISQETHAAELKRLEEALQASEERLSALAAAKTQIEETQRTNEETHSVERKRLEEALRASEEQLNVLAAAKTQIEETQRTSEETHTAERMQMEESLRASEEQLSVLAAAKAQIEETQRTNEETYSVELKRLEEALQASEERLSALTVAKAQIEETQRTNEETHSVERKRLEEALRASEEQLSVLAAAKAQIEETQRISEETHTAERMQMEESLRASEERLSALTAAKAQLEEALRVSNERENTLTAAGAQLQESLEASEATLAAERKRLEEALRTSEERISILAAAKAQIEGALRTSEETFTNERKRLEEAFQASEGRAGAASAAKTQVEETLRARDKHYSALTAATAQLVWTTNAVGEMAEPIPSWMTFTGQSGDEAKGKGWLQALHPEDRERAEEVLKQALDARRPYEVEYRLRRHDGEFRVLAVRGAPVVEDDGTVHEWIGTANDTTDAKQAEMLRRASEKKYRQIVERAPEGIWIVDPDDRTSFANPRMAQMLGWSEEKMAGKSLFDFLGEEDRQSAEENLACCRRGVAVQFDLRLRTLEGQNLQTRASTLPLFDETGQYSGALALIIDLTEQKLIEAERHQAQKLQALGQLAGGVAHGLNNFLTVINGYTELLLGKVPRSNPMHESVAQIKKAAEQAADLVSPLLTFSQGQILWAKVLDLNDMVMELEKTLRGQFGEAIQVTTVLNPSLGPVKADPEQLRQVLMILAANARDAMRDGGSLVIETQNVVLDESYAAKHLALKPGPYAHLTISDSGTGMSAETLTHVFEPFFTTKPPGQGSGLGLASAYGFVQQSGGSIRVESELGKGSTVHLYLPRMGEAIPVSEEEKPAVTTLRGTETVLVVEDQEEIRKLAQMVLKSYGYKVVVAENGWEALLYSERHAGPIHLMLTDVAMPGMTGQELADRLKPLRPEMKVAFMSGYVENGTVQSGALESGAGFLAKPFSPDALATKVREVLGPPRTAGKVLVVDAEAGIRSFLLMVLGSVGYDVLAADNGEQALRNLDGERVDLILVDLGNSCPQEMEKVHLLQKRHPGLKVIAMSENLGDEFLRAAEKLGAQATLAKPIRADQLLETVRRTAAE